jgi:hypothetical protein
MTNVTVHYLFSKNEKIGSRIIVEGTAYLESELNKDTEVPSHVAILVNNKWVFESTLETGVRRISYEKWLEINSEVAKYKCTTYRTLEEVINYFRSIKDKKYDYIGATYFGYRILLNKLLSKPIPEINTLEDEDKYFCCEVMGKMLGLDYRMTAPVQIMVQAKDLLT